MACKCLSYCCFLFCCCFRFHFYHLRFSHSFPFSLSPLISSFSHSLSHSLIHTYLHILLTSQMANGYTSAMIGQHADIVFADGLAHSLDGFDVQTAFEGMVQGATTQQQHASRPDVKMSIALGYTPYEVRVAVVCCSL